MSETTAKATNIYDAAICLGMLAAAITWLYLILRYGRDR
jgi:hypothetical protein